MNFATNLSVQRLGDLMNSSFEKHIVMLIPLISIFSATLRPFTTQNQIAR
ncbi:MAG: hypothetical protein WCI39_02615 [Gallionellaceae bacterium]